MHLRGVLRLGAVCHLPRGVAARHARPPRSAGCHSVPTTTRDQLLGRSSRCSARPAFQSLVALSRGQAPRLKISVDTML